MNHNKLEELTICVCDYFNIAKKEIIINRNCHFQSKAKQILIHLAIKHDVMDKHRLAFFLHTAYDVINNSIRKMDHLLLHYKAIKHEYDSIEYNFLNQKLSIYES